MASFSLARSMPDGDRFVLGLGEGDAGGVAIVDGAVGYDFGGVLGRVPMVRRVSMQSGDGRPRRRWPGPVAQLFALPLAGAIVLVVALSGPLFVFSFGAAVAGLFVLVAPSAASFGLARRAGREPAAVMAWGTLCLQLVMTAALTVLL